jgi:hypothetical protein
MGCTSEREVIKIKLNKRLLLTTAAGVAIIMSAVLLVSMRGNDTPNITTNPPNDEQQPPASDTDIPAANNEPNTEPTGPGTDDEPEEQGPDDDQGTGDNGNGNGNGSDAPKKKGLERAIEVHERNIAKKMEKGNPNALKNLDSSKGLTHSLEVLKTNLDKHADQQELQDGGNGHGLAKGHTNT